MQTGHSVATGDYIYKYMYKQFGCKNGESKTATLYSILDLVFCFLLSLFFSCNRCGKNLEYKTVALAHSESRSVSAHFCQ